MTDQPHTALSVDQLLELARARLERIPVEALADELAAGALVVDTRPASYRDAEGELPGALVVERNDLEWRLCPTSEHRAVDIDADQRVIVVCNDGYASSLSAVVLQDLGVPRATDLIGGYRAWRRHAGG